MDEFTGANYLSEMKYLSEVDTMIHLPETDKSSI